MDKVSMATLSSAILEARCFQNSDEFANLPWHNKFLSKRRLNHFILLVIPIPAIRAKTDQGKQTRGTHTTVRHAFCVGGAGWIVLRCAGSNELPE
jgi:hypothetical protein